MKTRLPIFALLILVTLPARAAETAALPEPGPADGGLRLRLVAVPRTDPGKEGYEVRVDTAFAAVLDGCADRPQGTWLGGDMKKAYLRLHRAGHAHSFETWLGGELVGGLYGVALGRVFFGESMFTHAPDASKVAFVTAARALFDAGCLLIDCQVETEHLARFGAGDLPRRRFLQLLGPAVQGSPSLHGVFASLTAPR